MNMLTTDQRATALAPWGGSYTRFTNDLTHIIWHYCQAREAGETGRLDANRLMKNIKKEIEKFTVFVTQVGYYYGHHDRSAVSCDIGKICDTIGRTAAATVGPGLLAGLTTSPPASPIPLGYNRVRSEQDICGIHVESDEVTRALLYIASITEGNRTVALFNQGRNNTTYYKLCIAWQLQVQHSDHMNFLLRQYYAYITNNPIRMTENTQP